MITMTRHIRPEIKEVREWWPMRTTIHYVVMFKCMDGMVRCGEVILYDDGVLLGYNVKCATTTRRNMQAAVAFNNTMDAWSNL
jgi:hypothetical protein